MFGYAHVRKLERSLITEYEEAIGQALAHLGSAYDHVARLVELPQIVSGYESVKVRNAAVYRTRLQAALGALSEPVAAPEDVAALAV